MVSPSVCGGQGYLAPGWAWCRGVVPGRRVPGTGW